MFRPVSLFVGLRYSSAGRHRHLVSFITLLSIGGLALAVALLLLALSVMNGFERELRQRILGLMPHASVEGRQPMADWRSLAADIVESDERVVGVAPYARMQGMLMRAGRSRSALVYGVVVEAERAVSVIESYLPAGAFDRLSQNANGMLMGSALAASLGLQAGDSVTMVVPHSARASDRLAVDLHRFEVVGLFTTGTELDPRLALVNLSTAMAVKRWDGAAQGLRLRLADLFSAPRVAGDWSMALGPAYTTSDWSDSHGNLYAAIQLSRRLVGLLLLFLVAVAAFNVVSCLVMIVDDKRSAIAVLRTLGASSRQVMGVFVVQGTVIGVVGTALGVLLGIALSLSAGEVVAWLERVLSVRFLDESVYPVNYLPSEWRWRDAGFIAAIAMGMCALATLYPVWRAARVAPARALRHE